MRYSCSKVKYELHLDITGLHQPLGVSDTTLNWFCLSPFYFRRLNLVNSYVVVVVVVVFTLCY